MRVHVRPTLALAAVVVLVFALRPSFGFWPPGDRYGLVFFGAMSALVLAFAATVMPDRTIERVRAGPPLEITNLLLVSVALFLVGVNVLSTGLLYADDPGANATVTHFALLG